MNLETTLLLRRYNTSEPIYKQLPVKCVGGGDVTTLEGLCADCGALIAPDHLRGDVSVFQWGVKVRAVGRCSCKGGNLLTMFVTYVLPDGKDGMYTVGRQPGEPKRYPWENE